MKLAESRNDVPCIILAFPQIGDPISVDHVNTELTSASAL
jgi:hypothetical protein